MSPTSLADFKKRKEIRNYTQVKPLTKLTPEQMKSTSNKKRREE